MSARQRRDFHLPESQSGYTIPTAQMTLPVVALAPVRPCPASTDDQNLPSSMLHGRFNSRIRPRDVKADMLLHTKIANGSLQDDGGRVKLTTQALFSLRCTDDLQHRRKSSNGTIPEWRSSVSARWRARARARRLVRRKYNRSGTGGTNTIHQRRTMADDDLLPWSITTFWNSLRRSLGTRRPLIAMYAVQTRRQTNPGPNAGANPLGLTPARNFWIRSRSPTRRIYAPAVA